jgi:hypothetical protein
MNSNSLSSEAMANGGTVVAVTSTTPSNVGIDLNTALEILSQRSSLSHNVTDNKNPTVSRNSTSDLVSNGSIRKSVCECCSVVNENESQLPSLNSTSQREGQLIDIGTVIDHQDDPLQESFTIEKHEVFEEKNEQEVHGKQKEQHETQQRALERQQQLAITIQSMTIKEIISVIFRTQEERVRTYRFYEE